MKFDFNFHYGNVNKFHSIERFLTLCNLEYKYERPSFYFCQVSVIIISNTYPITPTGHFF